MSPSLWPAAPAPGPARVASICLVASAALASLPAAAQEPAVPRLYEAVEHQPAIPRSGRVNDVAMDPSSLDHVLATTESGGLWQSTDGGVTWRSVEGLPVFKLMAVHFVAANPRVVLVTAREDFQRISHTATAAPGFSTTIITSGGGVWMSRDGGATWSMPWQAIPPATAGSGACTTRREAFGIAEDRETGRIFVATNCGVSFVDGLASNAAAPWTHRSFTLSLVMPLNRQFSAVAALEGQGVVLGGGDGVWWSDDNGGSWTRTSTAVGPVFDLHAASGVAGEAGQGFMISVGRNNDRRLWRTRDGGRTWEEVAGDPRNGSGCGGIAHVRAFRVRLGPYRYVPPGRATGYPVTIRGVGLYYGNACHTYRHFADPAFSTINPYAGWVRMTGSHDDTRAVGLLPADLRADTYVDGFPEARFLASDGGLDRRTPGGLVPVGSGPTGLNALQVYDLEGQWVRETGAYRLAFGTQDNRLWSSTDETTWPESQATGPEAGGIRMARVTSTTDAERWTYVTCTGCGLRISDPLFQSQEDWPGYATRGAGWKFSGAIRVHPTALPGWYVHVVYPDTDSLRATGATLGLELTPDYGGSYFRFAQPTEETRGAMVVNRGVIYQAVKHGTFTETTPEGTPAYMSVGLLRITGILSSRFRRVDTAAMNGFGSIGHYAYQFAWNPVYGVNPQDPNHLIAPDVRNRLMMMSRNGGEDWAEIAGLTAQLTRGGRYDLALPTAGGDYSLSLVSAVSFFPDNPDLVALGLQQGGAYVSEDGGVRWQFVRGSERISNITEFEWKSASEIYVSSYGRGLWKIQPAAPLFDLARLRDFLRLGRGDVPVLRNLVFGDLYVLPISAAAPPPEPAPPIAAPPGLNPVPLVKVLDGEAYDAVVLAVDGAITGMRAGGPAGARFETMPGTTLYTFARDPKAAAAGPSFPQQPPHVSLHLAEAVAARLARELKIEPPRGRLESAEAAYKALGGDPESAVPLSGDATAPGGGQTEPPPVVTVGVLLKGGQPAAVVVGAPVTYPPPLGAVPVTPSPRKAPPARFDGGYVVLPPVGPVYFGSPVYGGDRPMRVEGRAFRPGRDVVLELDGRPVQRGVRPDAAGRFVALVSLRDLLPGVHQLTVRQDLGDGTEDTDVRVFAIHPEDTRN